MDSFGRFPDFAQLRAFLVQSLREYLFSITEKSAAARKYRFEHCLRVAQVGRQVALADSTPHQPIDPDSLEIGCLLHDIGKWDAPVPVDHGRAGALRAYRLLRDAGLAQSVCQELAQGIAMHVDGIWNPGENGGTFTNRKGEKYFVFDHAPSFLARLIGQCDDIDRFSTYRIFDTLHYFKFLELDSAAQIQWIDQYLEKLAIESEKLRDTASLRQRWQENIDYQRRYFQRLRKEIAGSIAP
ncbi:HD domain-containing protein [Arcanobacterium hippocoleae]|uniref:HD domain-containing protein n=1 Tax=Arcanobacterium hippocoleae TaxID=149017 RepID=UPI003341D061